MTATPSSKKPARSSNANSVKMLITAASVASVVGGWAVFSVKQSFSASAGTTSDQTTTANANQVVVDLLPLPTLVPYPSGMQTVGVSASLPAPITGVSPTTPQLAPTPGAPRPVANVGGNSTKSGGAGKSGGGSKPPRSGGTKSSK